MTASLYQSGSSDASAICGSVRSGRARGSSGISVAGDGSGARAASALAAGRRQDAPDGGGIRRGIEADALLRAAPRLVLAGEELLGDELVLGGKTHFAEREVERRLVRLVRVEIDRDQN